MTLLAEPDIRAEERRPEARPFCFKSTLDIIGLMASFTATSVDIEACKRSTNVADGSGMAQHEPVARIEDSAETDGQECAIYGHWRLRRLSYHLGRRSAAPCEWVTNRPTENGLVSVKVLPASKGQDCATGRRLATKAETKVL